MAALAVLCEALIDVSAHRRRSGPRRVCLPELRSGAGGGEVVLEGRGGSRGSWRARHGHRPRGGSNSGSSTFSAAMASRLSLGSLFPPEGRRYRGLPAPSPKLRSALWCFTPIRISARRSVPACSFTASGQGAKHCLPQRRVPRTPDASFPSQATEGELRFFRPRPTCRRR